MRPSHKTKKYIHTQGGEHVDGPIRLAGTLDDLMADVMLKRQLECKNTPLPDASME